MESKNNMLMVHHLSVALKLIGITVLLLMAPLVGAQSDADISKKMAPIITLLLDESELLNKSDPQISISVANVNVNVIEGDSGTNSAEATVTLSKQSNKEVTVKLSSVDVTATAGIDYTTISETITFNAGVTSQEARFSILGDTTVELNEQFRLVLSDPTNATLDTSEVLLTILDDEPLLQPDNLNATTGNKQVFLSWNAVQNATGYKVHRALEPFGSLKPVNYSTLSGYYSYFTSTNTYTVPELTNDTTYYFVVTSISYSRESGAGNEVTATPYSLLNDTGIDWGGEYTSGNNSDCTSNTVPQDCDQGRDASNNNNSDGHAGFSFTKLDANGNPLVDQSIDYATTPWSCVKDNVTGLVWEVK
ncbi:MAG: hypothetical protein GY697_07375, partial [Desulfobacterales bacterium]|nr:hypothetical protein [Desulfobacterales bacterium]